jgi:hypothetical protein
MLVSHPIGRLDDYVHRDAVIAYGGVDLELISNGSISPASGCPRKPRSIVRILEAIKVLLFSGIRVADAFQSLISWYYSYFIPTHGPTTSMEDHSGDTPSRRRRSVQLLGCTNRLKATRCCTCIRRNGPG